MQCTISKLAFLSHSMDSEKQLDKQGLVTAVNFLDVLIFGTWSRVNRSCKSVVFGIHYHSPMIGLRDQIVAASGLTHVP